MANTNINQSASATNAQLDVVINKMDALLNGYEYDPQGDVPPFMDEPLAAMRALLGELMASNTAVTAEPCLI